jgi:hypothetical protein
MPHFMRIGGGSGQLLASSLSRQTVTHELVSNVWFNDSARFVGMSIPISSKQLKTLERVKGIEPSYSAWKSGNSAIRAKAIPTFCSLPYD